MFFVSLGNENSAPNAFKMVHYASITLYAQSLHCFFTISVSVMSPIGAPVGLFSGRGGGVLLGGNSTSNRIGFLLSNPTKAEGEDALST